MHTRSLIALALVASLIMAGCAAAAPTPGATPPATASLAPTGEPPATDPPDTDPPATSEPDPDPTEETPSEEPPASEEPTTAPEPTPVATVAPPSAPTGYAELDQAFAREFEGTTVSIMSQWIQAEGDNFRASLAAFQEQTGISLVMDGITEYEVTLRARVEGGVPPDIAQLAQPGLMREFAGDGHLIDLSTFFDVDKLADDYPQALLDLSRSGDGIYGVFYKADLKSIVWYPVEAFATAGYEIPATWDELVALSDQIVADGNGNPWCISIEHDAASGWVATDWIEDVLLRTAPAEIYDQWVNHEIPFNHPDVLEAVELVKQVWFTPDYAYGGNTYINSEWVGTTQDPMFDPAVTDPTCWMHKQAAWISDFWPTDEATEPPTPLYAPGEDVAFFYFPPIEPEYGNPVLGSGDMMVMFADRPEVRAVMQYLAMPESTKGWIDAAGIVAANNKVPQEWYAAYYKSAELARILAEATTLRFDASDSMPAEVGQGSFWTGMVEWVEANGENTEAIFQTIQDSWPAQ